MTLPQTDSATFDQLLSRSNLDVQDIARRLRALILDLHPAAVEVVRLGDNAASYGLGPKKMSEAYAYIMPQAAYVNLGFYFGATLPNPAGLLEGTGKKLRHVKVRSAAAVDAPALRQLLQASLLERQRSIG